MLRKILFMLIMGMLLVGAAYAGTSIPVLLLMGSLLLIALMESSVRNEPIE